MPKIKLSDYIAKRLKEFYNVEHFFMVSGGGAMHLNDSLGREIPYIANHHEQSCAIAAEGYARVNQKLAVVNVTTGPGGMNCLNGVFGQWTDSVPVLYISGQVKTTTTLSSCPELNLRQLGDQEVDIIQSVKHLTKYAKMISDKNEIKYHLDRAIYEATTGRFAPVWLDIPIDIQASLIEEDDLIEFVPPKAKEQDLKIDILLQMLQEAQKPLIIAGHGLRLSKQEEKLKELLAKSKIPAVTTFNGFDILEDVNPFYIGRIGTIGQRAGNFAIQNADLILCLGTRNNIRQVSYNWENYAKQAKLICVDIDEAELKKRTINPDLTICANLKDFMPALLEKISTYECSKWLNHCQKLKNKFCFENYKEHEQKTDLINPYYFTNILTKCLSQNDIFIMANGSACVCAFQNAVVKEGQRYLLNSGNASMGYALPAAIGACYQSGNRNVICLEGDGSIMMNLQELQTIVHNKLPIKLFVINNNGYSSIRQTQKNFFNGKMTGSGVESGVSVPDFVKVGEAFGLKSIKLENSESLEKQIENILNYKGAILCEVMVEKEYSFLPKLSAKKLKDGTMISPSLEDMFPFLDKDEYEECMI